MHVTLHGEEDKMAFTISQHSFYTAVPRSTLSLESNSTKGSFKLWVEW